MRMTLLDETDMSCRRAAAASSRAALPADRQGRGKHAAQDAFVFGGRPTIIDQLATIGEAIGDDLEDVNLHTQQSVAYPLSSPISAVGSVPGRSVPLTPVGAIVKVARMKELQACDPSPRVGGTGALAGMEKSTPAPETFGHTSQTRRKSWNAPTNPYRSGLPEKHAGRVARAVAGSIAPVGGKAGCP